MYLWRTLQRAHLSPSNRNNDKAKKKISQNGFKYSITDHVAKYSYGSEGARSLRGRHKPASRGVQQKPLDRTTDGVDEIGNQQRGVSAG